MPKVRYLIIALVVLALASPALAKKKKDKEPKVPNTRREALAAAPIFADPWEQQRGQQILNEACAAMLGQDAICDLVIKDTEVEGFYFKPDSGVMLTSIEMLDTLKEAELRAAFAWSIGYAESGLREKATKLQQERFDALDGLSKINPSVGVGTARASGNVVVGAGVSLGPGAVLAIADGLAQAVEDARLSKELRALDTKVTDNLYISGFGRHGMVKLLKRTRAKGGDYLADRETGIGRVDQARIRKAEGR